MAGVRIDSGAITPEQFPRDVPREKWSQLVLLRRDFLSLNLNYDCRCLVQFVKEAEQLWGPLGYADADALIRDGYGLEPEEIRLAVRWLEINEPEAIGLDEVKARTARERSEAAAKATTGEVLPEGRPHKELPNLSSSQPERATAAGVSRSQQQKLDALARKAPDKLAEVRAGTKSTHRACVEAGIVKEKTAGQWLSHWWAKATAEERAVFLAEV